MRKQFWALYKKEFKESAGLMVIYGVLTLGWLFLLAAQKGHWRIELVFGLSFIPLGLLPFYAMLKGFISYRSEWKDDTIYTLKALPVPGWYFMASKFLATMTHFTILSFVSLGGTYFIGFKYINALLATIPSLGGKSWLWNDLFLIYIIFWLANGLNYLICQFSYLSSRLFNKLTGLITGVTFLLSYWLLFRVVGFISILFKWLPDFTLKGWSQYNDVFYIEIIKIETAPWIALSILVLGLAWVGSWILENVLEV
ncbi:MAG: hypothetical protein KAX49_02605 [Halanaerobiales bacterium]|nr:hypothetical protein [Halanaerobiales bacterium]